MNEITAVLPRLFAAACLLAAAPAQCLTTGTAAYTQAYGKADERALDRWRGTSSIDAGR